MADRTSAELFGMMFEALASGKMPTAESLWRMQRSYDFSPYQMGCDKALKKLGLLWICPRNDHHNYDRPNYGPPKESKTCDDCGDPRPAA